MIPLVGLGKTPTPRSLPPPPLPPLDPEEVVRGSRGASLVAEFDEDRPPPTVSSIPCPPAATTPPLPLNLAEDEDLSDGAGEGELLRGGRMRPGLMPRAGPGGNTSSSTSSTTSSATTAAATSSAISSTLWRAAADLAGEGKGEGFLLAPTPTGSMAGSGSRSAAAAAPLLPGEA